MLSSFPPDFCFLAVSSHILMLSWSKRGSVSTKPRLRMRFQARASTGADSQGTNRAESPSLLLLTDRHSLQNEFSQMRTTSNLSPRFLQQLQLMSQSCLTYKLYTLSSRIRVLHREIEVARIACFTAPSTDKGSSDGDGRTSACLQSEHNCHTYSLC